ncbi:RsmD family RNA methyltransferase [Peredibacter sp. HCB2-198]|uniref:RsmD family RNA methyltransferase n=1 Tax=Peredibacter starrii TaxID=28202 RepID=A0AAX4HMF5_9BACT|nr:RsmD family RNA methyltransferase [Peredibacter starrii]WPU64401.1 RsmD family RNA methyltransferase [Peredibacter starrii]
MSIKILGGIARGYPLATPKADSTRPTSVLIKRKLFDWRQHMDEYIFVDLCAGSGAMGYEALSRGSQKVFVNDSMRGAFLTLKDNKANLEKAFKFEPDMITVTNLDAKNWVQKELQYQLPETENVILFFDPPYENHALYFDVLKILKEMNFQGEVWVESDRLKGPKIDLVTGAFQSVIKKVEQGDHFVVVGKLV